ncbi:hypothetical protein PMAYCL1PPCAC_16142 [Pristionchus mayeri]|uniref:Uncharacterized protein n=1 Tax=Pristionchus mayeri TaxID=1317129 RepID=A0AAN5CK70_9BILA|nr:hypothetical protein PMAYCL1PPCAC_16142 [Pristionchus mayeri]
MVIRLAQSGTKMFPFLFFNERTDRYEGIFSEVWQMFCAHMGEEMEIIGSANGFKLEHEDFADENGRYVGVIGAVQNRTADATIEDFMMDEKRLREFHVTLPFVTMTMTGLYTRVRRSEAWPIDAFIVFPYKIAALIIAIGIIEFLLETLPELFGYEIKMGEVSGKAEIIPDMQTMADMLCDPSSSKIVTAYIILYSIFSVNPAHPHSLNCDLEPVDVSDRAYLKENLPGFYEVNVNVPYPAVFYLNRARFRRSTIDRFNQIVQGMFDMDKQETLWWGRFTGRHRQTYSNRKPKFACTPLPLGSLVVPFYVCAALLLASFVCFIFELSPCSQKLHRSLRKYARYLN